MVFLSSGFRLASVSHSLARPWLLVLSRVQPTPSTAPSARRVEGDLPSARERLTTHLAGRQPQQRQRLASRVIRRATAVKTAAWLSTTDPRSLVRPGLRRVDRRLDALQALHRRPPCGPLLRRAFVHDPSESARQPIEKRACVLCAVWTSALSRVQRLPLSPSR